MSLLYDIIYFVFLIVYLPVFLLRRKFHPGFGMRFGILPKQAVFTRPIWVHAVSVGEMTAMKPLVALLRSQFPGQQFVFSTVTATGNKIACSVATNNDIVIYLPLDISFVVRKVIKRIRPKAMIIAETEFWPNLIHCLSRSKIPMMIVNGRISDRSFGRYKAVRTLLQGILNCISVFCMQSATDVSRLAALGVDKDKIKLAGNLKFDIQPFVLDNNIAKQYRDKLAISKDEQVFIAASTHPQEEEIILSVFKNLLDSGIKLKLILAPRHPERAESIKSIAARIGFSVVLISQTNKVPADVFILDTIGELMHYYAISDLVFVGGSLVPNGGHNILEPVSLQKAVLFGPYMFNFRDIAALFLQSQAVISVTTEQDMTAKLKELLHDPLKRKQISDSAYRILLENQGAVKRSVEYLKPFI